MRLAGILFDSPRVLKIGFNACALFSWEYCAPVWKLSIESLLGLLDSIIRSAEML